MTLLEKYEKLVAPANWSKKFVKWSFLAALSAILERRCWVEEGIIGHLYPNLYVMFVGPPASKKTTTAKKPVELFLTGLDNGPVVSSNQLTPATLVKQLKRAGSQRYEHNTSPLFAISGEASVMLQDIGGGSIIDLLLEFYDSRPPGTMWAKETVKHGLEEMVNPALTFLGCTTPQALIESRISSTAGTGFTSRVIFVCEPGNIRGTNTIPKLDEGLRRDVEAHLVRINQTIAGPFTYSSGALIAREGMLERVQHWQDTNTGSTMYAHYMARKATQVCKVAMLCCAMRTSTMLIEAEDFRIAEALLTELEPTLNVAFGLQINYKDSGLMAKLLDRIPTTHGLSEQQLLRTFAQDGQGIPYNHEFMDAINGLTKLGAVAIKSVEGTLVYIRKDFFNANS